MPTSSKFVFVVELDAAEAQAQAREWKASLGRELSGFQFTIAGLDAADAQLKSIQKTAAKVGAALFQGSDKQVTALQERLAEVSSSLYGIVRRPATAPGFVDQLTAQLNEASEAAGGLGARMVRSLAESADQVRQTSRQIEALEAEITQLGAAPLLPRTVTGQAEPSRMEYYQARRLMDAAAATEAAGKQLTKAQQEAIARVQANDALLQRVVTKSYDQPLGMGYDALLAQEHDKSRQAIERMAALQREIDALIQRRIAAQQKLEKAKTPSAGLVELPADAKGTLVDLVNAERALGEAVKGSLDSISSQTRRLSGNVKQLEAVAKAAQALAQIEQKLGRSLSADEMRAFAALPDQAGQAAAATESRLSGLAGRVGSVIARLRGQQKGAFDPLVQEAQEASDKIVGNSIIPDMVQATLRWLATLRAGQDQAFDPLVQDARQAAGAVNRAFAGMTGEDVFRANAAAFEADLQRINAASQRLVRTQAEGAAALRRMNLTQEEWGRMGGLDKIGAALMAGEMQTWAVRNVGMRTQQAGRSLMMAGTAELGALALAGKEYLQYAQPAQRAAANLQVEMSKVNDILLASTDTARKYFDVTTQAAGLYKWAAATGVVVRSQEQLQAVLDRQMLPVEQLQLMHSGELELSSAVDITSQILAQYNKRLDETAQVTADLNAIAAYSQATVSDIGQAFAYVGDISEEMGISFEETGSALQLLADRGQKGSRAGRGLAMALTDLVKPSEQAAAALDKLFGRDYREVLFPGGRFVGLAQAIDLLAAKTAKYTDAQRQEALATVFDQNALRAILPLVSMEIQGRAQGINVIQAMTKARMGQRDAEVDALEQMISAQRGYSTNLESSLTIWQQMWADFERSDVARAQAFQARWNKSIVSIGQSAVQIALPYLEQLARGFERLADVARANPEAVRAAMVGGSVLVAVGALVSLLGKGIMLYTDVKLISAAAMQLQAANRMLEAATLQTGASATGGAPAVAAGGAAKTARGLNLAWLLGRLALALAPIQVVAEGQAARDRTQESYIGMYKGLDREQQMALLNGPQAPLYYQETARGYELYERATGELATQESIMRALAEIESARPATIEQINRGLEASTQRWQAIGAASQKAAQQPAVETAAEDYGLRWLRLQEAVARARREYQDGTRDLYGITEAYRQAGESSAYFEAQLLRHETTVDRLSGKYLTFGQAVLAATQAMRAVPTNDELLGQAQSEGAAGWSKLTGLVGLVPREQLLQWGQEYAAGLAGIYTRLRGHSQAEIDLEVAYFNAAWDGRIDKVRSSSQSIIDTQKQVAQAARQAQEAFASSVAAMLEPTAVTDEDMAATQAGAYLDKWDEAARRMKAAMSDPNSPWRKAMIPEGVLAGGEGAIQAYGQGWLKQFYGGMLPDEVNWDAFAKQYQDMIAQKLGKQNLVQRAIQELGKRGIKATNADVQKALGIESPLQQMFFGGLTPEEAGTQLSGSVTTALSNVKIDPKQLAGTSATLAQTLTGGLGDEMNNISVVAMLVAVWSADIKDNGDQLLDVGRSIGAKLWDGLLDRLKGSGIVDHIVAEVLDALSSEFE